MNNCSNKCFTCEYEYESKEISFSDLLKQYDKILIPKIQRDYAQGRKDTKATDIRKNLLDDIFSKEKVKLDFIFGTNEILTDEKGDHNCFIPLDGQQRLTTLFLLYLYNFKVNKCNCVKIENEKFSYETRRAAKDFCKTLIDKEWEIKDDENDDRVLSNSLKNTVWFMEYWEHDPTVISMLTMLDAIHNKASYSSFPNLDKITFRFFDMNEHKLNNNLYLKMNSRGKPLTVFENLKAEMDSILPKGIIGNAGFEFIKDDNLEKQEGFSDKWKYYIDRTWTSFFWKYKENNLVDPPFIRFIANCLLCFWISKNESLSQKEIRENKILHELRNVTGNEEYLPFDVFKDVLRTQGSFEYIAKSLNTFIAFPHLQNEKANWASTEDGVPFETLITKAASSNNYFYKERVIFYAITAFQSDEYNSISFKKWMRVVWNVVENGGIDSPETMVGGIRLIDELANYSNYIYGSLANSSIKIDSGFAQMDEEKEKARIIIRDEKFTNEPERENWEKKIIEAEKQLFFKGKVGYLLKASEYNYEKFSSLLELCKKKIIIDNDDCNKELLKSFFTYIDLETLPIYCKISSYDNWKDILTNKRSEKATVSLFMNEFKPQSNDGSWGEWKIALISDFEEINPINGTIKNYYTNGWWGYREDDVFIYVNANISAAKLLSLERKAILSKLIKQDILQNHFSLYPNTNDHGQLWINQDYFTDSFKLKIEQPSRVNLFISKNSFELKLWNNERWEGVEIDVLNSPNLSEKLIEDIKEKLLY